MACICGSEGINLFSIIDGQLSNNWFIDLLFTEALAIKYPINDKSSSSSVVSFAKQGLLLIISKCSNNFEKSLSW